MNIEFYGASWCGDCVRAKAFLVKHNVTFEYIDVDFVASAAAKVESINNGKRIIPTLIVDGVALTNPSNEVLAEALKLDVALDAKDLNTGEACSIDNKDACQ